MGKLRALLHWAIDLFDNKAFCLMLDQIWPNHLQPYSRQILNFLSFSFIFCFFCWVVKTQLDYFGQLWTLCACLFLIQLTNLFFVCFLEQPLAILLKAHGGIFLEIRNFLCIITKNSLFNLEMNGSDFVTVCCTHS